MTAFKIKRHLEIDEDYQGINLTEFELLDEDYFSNEELLNQFIHSTHFTFDSLRDIIKNKSGFLGQAFNSEVISSNDFKKLTKKQTLEFLDEFENDDSWGVDRKDFTVLKDKFISLIEDVKNSTFYVLIKDWFKKPDDRVNENGWFYSYYFLIIWIAKEKSTLTISEWTYD